MTARTRSYKSVTPTFVQSEAISAQVEQPAAPPDQTAQSSKLNARSIIIIVALLLSLVLIVRFVSQQITERQLHRMPDKIELNTGLAAYPIVQLVIEQDGDGYIVTDEDGDRFWCPAIPDSMDDEQLCNYVGEK